MDHGVEGLTARRLLRVLADQQVRGRLPSVVGGVVRGGALVWSGCYGDPHSGEPAGDDLQYRIGSITKTMTAVLVLQCRDEGLVDLNDPVSAYLGDVPYGDRSLRSLLSHSSGMQAEPPGPWWERSPGVSWEQLVEATDDAASAFAPGVTYHYTNLGFAVLGQVVARVRERSWWSCVAERVLRPLGMARTSYLPQAPAATGWSVHPFAGTLTPEPATDTAAMAPAGQVWSTVRDLASYAGFLLRGDPDVLPLRTLQEMSTPQSGSLAGGLTGAYGLGLRLLPAPAGTLVGHTGSMPGFVAGLFVDRARDSGAVVLANGTTGLRSEELAPSMLATLEECEPALPRPWSPPASVPPLVAEVLGLWHWGNTAFTVGWDGDHVAVRALASGLLSHTFRLEADGRLIGASGYLHGEVLQVVRRPDGGVGHLECATFVFTRTPYDPEAPIPGGAP